MAFKSPLFPLGLSAPPYQAGYRSLLAFWIGGAFSGLAPEPPEPPQPGAPETPVITFAVKRCKAFPWWRGTLARGVYGWAHTRMDLPSICDFYWAAQTLSLTGQINAHAFAGAIVFSGVSTLAIQPHELLVYQPRFVQSDPTGDGNYGISVQYVFSQPLHWDGLDGTFCPEMALRIDISHNVSPDPPEELGYITLDPNDAGAVEVGTAYLLEEFEHGLTLPLYYAGAGVLTGVSAEVHLTGVRWEFED